MTRKLKLLSVGHSYAVALNRRLVHEMLAQSARRWDVSAAAPAYFHGAQDLRPLRFQPLAKEPCHVHVVPTHHSRHVHVFSYGRKLRRILAEKWDLVHAWEEPYIFAGHQIARWTPPQVPLVYRTAQSLDKWYPPPFNWFEKYNMRRAAGWVCCGRSVARTLSARALYANRPMRLIPLGVDVNLFRPDRCAGEQMRRTLGWDEARPPVVGFLGRFTAAKGLPLLMGALEKLQTPWRALFVGSGPMEKQMRAWAGRFEARVRICTDVMHDQVPS
jgi:glycosyltransferase involved in cell wall biosynthesis